MAIVWNKVTWYSKLLAVLFFIVILPIWIIYMKQQYESAMYAIEISNKIDVVSSSTIEKEATGEKKGALTSAVYSGVKGISTIGPTCPAIKEGDPTCEDKPFSAYIIVKNNSGKVVTQTISRPDGLFALVLEPGTYTIEKAGGATTMPYLEPKIVTVPRDKIVEVAILFDSGIR